MDFLENVISDGLALLPEKRAEAFLRALRHSLTVDPDTYSPESFEPFGFSQRELYDLRVLLLRPLALEFLHQIGYSLSKSQIDRHASYAAYEGRFQRPPWLISVRPRIMMLTYTEWLALVIDTPPEIVLPDSLQTV